MEYANLSQTLSSLRTNDKTGLSTVECRSRLISSSKNVIDKKKKPSLILMFLKEINNPMIYILIIASLISLFLREIVDALIIIIVVILNAIIGLVQEVKAEKAIESLIKLTTPHFLVIRDNKEQIINVEDLVIGDIILINEGDIVPADCRVITCFKLYIDESSLTGESIPVEKSIEAPKESKSLGDMTHLLYKSTHVVQGHGKAVVIKTGMNTEIGKIAKMLLDTKIEQTPLQKRLDDLGKSLGIITIFICIFLFLVSIFRKYAVIETLIASISLGVAAIPEGLPAVVTMVLSLGVLRLSKVNTIVRKLPSVETLGAVSVICSDKTGTITENKMTVVEKMIYSNEELFLHGLVLCSTSSDSNGDPTEIALVQYARKKGINYKELRDLCPKEDEIPFSSIRKMMSVMVSYKGEKITFSKGALEKIINRCDYIQIGNIKERLNDNQKKDILLRASKMEKEALRIIALAYDDGYNEIEQNLTFLGFVGMIDPPRKEVKESIQKLKEGGVKTIMITGDNINTAFSIAKKVGIASKEEQCIEGFELDEIIKEKQYEKLDNILVYARVNPNHKVFIVEYLKKRNEIVAMTGDGVNDAPALKAADIGIAMGKMGTEVAKDAADMILTDDNFTTIEKACEEGRTLYNNIRKSVLFLLSSNFAEVLVMFLALILGFPAPLSAIHILWINLISDSLPALALGVDGKEKDVMKQKPRPKNESLFANGGYLLTIVYSSVICFITFIAFLIIPSIEAFSKSTGIIEFFGNVRQCLSNEEILKRSQTFAFTTLGISQLFHMIGMTNVKESFIKVFKKKNKLLWLAFFVGLTLQLLVTEIPLFVTYFKTSHLKMYEWCWLLTLAFFPLVIHELLTKVFIKRSRLQLK